MNKNKTLAERIREKKQTPYQIIAKKFSTSAVYVGQIATGSRKPIRGKGLKIKKELEKLVR
ncbi:XRE family transcriptional regulator [Riemerella anatipestifer]|nr:XRE family transcriptional regulator [Riemerella anatipestifer]